MQHLRAAWSWASGKLLYPSRHIRWKIIAPYVGLTIVLAAAGTYMATRLVTGSLEERFNNQLAEAGRVTSDSVVRRERKHLELVRAIAFTEGAGTATEAGDRSKLRTLVEPLAANQRADVVEVLDVRGQRVLGVRLADSQSAKYEPLDEPQDRATWPIVESVLRGQRDQLGDKFAQVAETTHGYALYTAGPIFDHDRLAGVVLVGSLFNSWLPLSKGEALADITIYDFNGVPIATTFAASDNKQEADLTPGQASFAQFGAPTGVRERKTLFGRGYELLYGELVVRDQAVAAYSVALPSSFILSAGGTTRWQMGLLFALATAVVLTIGWALARSLTKPLLRLVGTARAVTAGDLTARSSVRTGDEVGLLASSFDAMTERLQRQHLATIRALTAAIDARDPYTAGHSARVGQLAVDIGVSLGLPDSQLQHLEIGGYLHDIGKIGVRDAVLLKPDRLTPEERELIERHPRVGLDILSAVELAPQVVAFVANHHEKLDGSGYPHGLRGDNLGVIARIATVSDIYDALTTDRPYRAGLSPEEALGIIRREVADGKLDGLVVGKLADLIPAWERRRRTDSALKGFRLQDRPLAMAA